MVVSPNPAPFHSLTSIPIVFVSVSVSAPQVKTPPDHVSFPVTALHVWSPDPYNCDDDEYDVFSKATEVEVPPVSKTVLPIERLAVVRAMLVTASTTKELENSSKLRELDVTPRPEKREPPILSDEILAVPPTSKLVVTDAPLLKVHTPVAISFSERLAGPPAPQSKAIVVSNVPEAVNAK